MQILSTRSYRAYYWPAELPAETGVLPFVQLRAATAEKAQVAAHHVTGRPIDRVERLEEVSA